MNDKRKIAELLANAYRRCSWNAELSAEIVEGWFSAFQKVPFELFAKVYGRALMKEKGFPVSYGHVTELLEHVTKKSQHTALLNAPSSHEAFDWLLKRLRADRDPSTLLAEKTVTPEFRYAYRCIGGWDRLKSITEADIKWLRKEFCEKWDRASEVLNYRRQQRRLMRLHSGEKEQRPVEVAEAKKQIEQ